MMPERPIDYDPAIMEGIDEALIYRPRSYIECLDDDVSQRRTKRERPNTHPTKRRMPTSLMDLHGFHYDKEQQSQTMRSSRSRTLVERCEIVGERLKSVVHRTSSLDILFKGHKKPTSKSDLLEPRDNKTVSRSKVLEARKETRSDRIVRKNMVKATLSRCKSDGNYNNLKIRTQSLNETPLNKRAHKNSNSFDSITGFNSNNIGFYEDFIHPRERATTFYSFESTPNMIGKRPIIKIELIDSDGEAVSDYNYTLNRKVSNISSGSTSTDSSDCTASDTDNISSECSANICGNPLHTTCFSESEFCEILVDNDKRAEEKLYCRSLKKNKRPTGFIEMLTNDIDVDTPSKPSSYYKEEQHNITNNQKYYKNIESDIDSSEIVEKVDVTSELENNSKDLSNHRELNSNIENSPRITENDRLQVVYDSDFSKPKSMSMIELRSKRNSDKRKKDHSDSFIMEKYFPYIPQRNRTATVTGRGVSEDLTKGSSTSFFKKFFKKRRTNSLPVKKTIVPPFINALSNRKCIQIESVV